MLVCQIVYPGSGYYQGNFVITQLDKSAPHDKGIFLLADDRERRRTGLDHGSAGVTSTNHANSLRGEYTSTLAGARSTFDTMLGTIARIEEACGGRSISGCACEAWWGGGVRRTRWRCSGRR